jgi:hypothetical protein
MSTSADIRISSSKNNKQKLKRRSDEGSKTHSHPSSTTTKTHKRSNTLSNAPTRRKQEQWNSSESVVKETKGTPKTSKTPDEQPSSNVPTADKSEDKENKKEKKDKDNNDKKKSDKSRSIHKKNYDKEAKSQLKVVDQNNAKETDSNNNMAGNAQKEGIDKRDRVNNDTTFSKGNVFL